MTNSRRHTPVCGVTLAETEKQDKRLANRRLRTRVKMQLRHVGRIEFPYSSWDYYERNSRPLPHLREVSDPWSFDKDGKGWFDPQQYPKLMRK